MSMDALEDYHTCTVCTRPVHDYGPEADAVKEGGQWMHRSCKDAPRKEEMEDVIRMLAKVWNAVPELRLGQLIVNVIPLDFRSDPFYVQDADMARHLYDFRENLKHPRKALSSDPRTTEML